MEAGGYIISADICEAGKYLGGINGGVFQVQEPGVIAAVAEEVLLFDAGVGIYKCALLWLDDGVDAFASCDDIESCEGGVVGQGSDMLGSGHCLT